MESPDTSLVQTIHMGVLNNVKKKEVNMVQPTCDVFNFKAELVQNEPFFMGVSETVDVSDSKYEITQCSMHGNWKCLQHDCGIYMRM